MGASFELVLDTTTPQIEILAPVYTIPEAETEFVVAASEQLAPNADIWVIDALGNRHDVTFTHAGDRFVGILTFSGFPFGITQLFAIVKDEVFNVSNRAAAAFNVRESADIKLRINSAVKAIRHTATSRRVNTETRSRAIKTEIPARQR